MDKRKPMLWDIFCKVIDNFGDIGVCWRLAVGLAARGESVRLWADDLSALSWLAPKGHPQVTALLWHDDLITFPPGDVVIEAFGCDLPHAMLAAMAHRAAIDEPPVWINLEYLTAESFAERAHGLPSPVMSGPATGLRKHFFYPGFTKLTGGLIREDDLRARQSEFDREVWLAQQGIAFSGELLVCLFCYEPPGLSDLLDKLDSAGRPVRLLVTPGRAARAVKAITSEKMPDHLAITWLPALPQTAFDELLWSCDINFVRGEDSLVRAIWAGAPLVWQAYPQHDGVHMEKLDALLDAIEAPDSLRNFHHAWNADAPRPLPELDLPAWGETVTQARKRLLTHEYLVTQLIRFAEKAR